MYELITEKTLAEYEAFISSHPKGHFAQSSLWGKQKVAWTWRAHPENAPVWREYAVRLPGTGV